MIFFKKKWMRRLFFLLAILQWQTSSTLSARTSATGIEQQQQKEEISGKVLDSSGEPLIGVSISEKGTSNGTITNEKGRFTLKVSPNAELTFSYIGYVSQNVTVDNRKIINITLQSNSKDLNDVVVVGYGTQKRQTMTGAISAVNSDDLDRSAATTASGALVGKIAGLNTRMPDGRPGAITEINIRNMGTPMFVIDGVVSDEAQFNTLDFTDIQSVSVLKDASAAIYGVKAGNGVLLVTTKRGRRNEKNTINFDASYGVGSLFKYPKPADAATYVKSYIQSDAIQGNTPKYTMDDLAKYQAGTEKGYQGFNWYDYIIKSAPVSKIRLSTSGGSKNINYHLSVGHTDQASIIRNYGGMSRTNANLAVDAQISKSLKLSGTFIGSIYHEQHPGVPGGDDTWQALFATYRNLPTMRPFANDNPKYPAQTAADGGINFGMMNYELAGKSVTDQKDAQFNIGAEFKLPLPGLVAKAQVGYHLFYNWYDNHEYTYKLYGYDVPTDTYPVVFDMTNPWREREIEQKTTVTTQFQLTYDKKIGLHSINAVGGVESYKMDDPSFWMHSRPASNSLSLIDMQSLMEFNDNNLNDGIVVEARLGYIGRLNYNYAEKYMLELSGRYDGSWQFAPGHRWGFFPSASLGWRISEEGFWKNGKIDNLVNDLKIRASYGIMGDDDLRKIGYRPFDYMAGYNYNQGGGVIDGSYIIGTQSRGLPVTTLSWLKSKIFDVGVDYSMLRGHLFGSVDYFRRLRTGLPAQRYDVLIPSEAGFGLPNENLNSDLMTGFDGSITWKNTSGAFTYSVGGNITYSRKYDWDQYKPRYGNSWDQYRNDHFQRPSDITWGLHAIGQFQSWDQIANYKIDNDRQGNTTERPGDIMYQDVNGDGVINSLDERPIGYKQGGLPYLNFGINLAVAYKGFDLAADFTGASYASYALDYESKLPFHGGGNNPQYYMDNQWMLSDITDPNSKLIPGKYPTLLVGNSNHANYWNSDFWTVNVNYVKLRNLQFGYTFPKEMLSKVNVQKLRVYLLMQNLFDFDNIPGHEVDPEITSGSGVQYPTNRVINVGVSLSF